MSIQAIARVLELELNDVSCKAVLIGLANHTNPPAQCFPSVRLLMRYTGLSERSVRTTIKKLETLGYLKVVRRKNSTNLYYLNLGGADFAPGGANDAPGGGADLAPITVNKEPKHNASKGAASAPPVSEDARDLLSEDWKPSDETWAKLEADYPNIDLMDQLKSFILKSRANRTIHRDVDEAFKGWMHRAKDLRLAPKARPQTAGSGPADPAARVRARENAANIASGFDKDKAGEDYMLCAKEWLVLGDREAMVRCALKAKDMARKGSWFDEHVDAFLAQHNIEKED